MSGVQLRLIGSVMVVSVLAACATGQSGSKPTSMSGDGEALARDNGCAGCHGNSFQGGVGPGWVGLAGTEVELEDGSTVNADAAYLFESIRDPSSKLVAGYGARMPRTAMSDDEIRAVVAYIFELSQDA